MNHGSEGRRLRTPYTGFNGKMGELTMSEITIRIDEQFREMIPPLSDDELRQLTANVRTEGCRDPLVVWQPEAAAECVLLDGHHRYEICEHESIPYRIVKLEESVIPDREAAADWIDSNQLGRRNLSRDQMSMLRGRRYNRLKNSHGGDRKSSRQNGDLKRTSQKLAKQHGVSRRTIERDGQFAEAVERLKVLDPEIEKAIVAGKAPPRNQIVKSAEPHRVDMFRLLGRYASDPDLSFEWADATKLAKEYEDILEDNRDAIARRGRYG